MYLTTHPFCPVEALPAPLYEAVCHVCQRTGAPPEVATSDVIAVISTVIQRRYKVKGLNGNVMPTTLNTLSLAPTAVGKGESYRTLFQTSERSEPATSTGSGDIVTIDHLLLQDVSISALMADLEGVEKSASIQLEDGFSFLDGPLMKRGVISKLTQTWSGPPTLKLGRHHGSKVAIEPCLAIGIRLQPDLFYAFQKRDKSFSRHLGLWPRFLTFCYDPKRFSVTPSTAVTSTKFASDSALKKRLGELLLVSENPDAGELARKVLVMDVDANAYLRGIDYWIKGQMDGEFYDIQDAAGRAAENTLRLASNFQVICHGEGTISREMIERAWAIVYWSLGQFRNVFVHALQPPAKPTNLKTTKLRSHQQKLNADMQFLLDCIGARGYYFPSGKVPYEELELLAGFDRKRFLKTMGWLLAGRLIEVEVSLKSRLVRLLPQQQAGLSNAYIPVAPNHYS